MTDDHLKAELQLANAELLRANSQRHKYLRSRDRWRKRAEELELALREALAEKSEQLRGCTGTALMEELRRRIQNYEFETKKKF